MCRQILVALFSIRFHKNSLSRSFVTYGQTDGHDEASRLIFTAGSCERT